jgi:hypothetical protein
MSQMQDSSQLYMRFLHLSQVVKLIPGIPNIDATEEKLLNLFATAWFVGKNIGVMDAMEMVEGISPRTVHRRMKTLRAKGLISLNSDHSGTKKYVVPTALTDQYFSEIGKCMAKALEG